MALPPAWKVKRELRRVYEKAKDAVALHPANPLRQLPDRLRQRHHDRNLHRLLRETPGARPLTARVAVFVLFQPKGIAGSTFLTLDHLTQEGWSTLVISNAPLTEADRTRLAAASGHVIERPNTGYDFGAYREGWRWLHRHGHALDRLILMNDSTWFPLRMNDDSLRRMEALNADLAGHIYKTENLQVGGLDHVESHLLMLSAQAISNPAVGRFWDDYLMTGDKLLTVLRGEKGLSQAVMAAGLSVKGLLGRDSMIAALSELSDPDLLAAVNRLAFHSEVGKAKVTAWKDAATRSDSWRDDFFTWTRNELSHSQCHYICTTYLLPAIDFCGLGFAKKTKDLRFHIARVYLCEALASGSFPWLASEIASELQVYVDAGPPVDWRSDPAERARSTKH